MHYFGHAHVQCIGGFLCLLLILLLTNACTVGPNFCHPPPPKIKRYTANSLPAHTVAAPTVGGKRQHFVYNKDIPAAWWEIFHSVPLNKLIRAALRCNPNISSADAGLRIAIETAAAQRAAFYPRVDFELDTLREQTAHTLSSNLASGGYFYTLITPQVTISYVPDVWGANSRQVESLVAQMETAAFQREAVALTITSNVVMAVIQEASLRAQIKATRRTIAIAKEQLKILRLEHEVGEIGLEGVAAQEAMLAQTEATLLPLRKQLAQQYHLIAVLCGHFPSKKILHQFDLESLKLPRDLPLSLPSRVVKQRPDIRAAEAQVHAAGALIGVALANRLPNIVLSAVGGSAALSMGTLFSGNTLFWTLSANLAQPIFDAGLLLHKQRAAVEACKQAVAQYRSVVLSAFQNVADTLKAIQFDAINLKAAKKAAQATEKSLSIAKQQRQAGAVGYLAVLNAEQAYQQAMINLAQSQASRFVDTVALFQALGGGWWNRYPCPRKDEERIKPAG
jgi:NodT family efflux transporter outer membrane factor (OMF) lipoprotein